MSTPQISIYSFEQLDTSQSAQNSPTDVLSAAWAEAERVRESARSEGEAAGHAEGLAQIQAQAAPLIEALGTAVRQVQSTREELVEQLTADAAELAVAIGEQILTTTLQLEPERVADTARAALRRLADRHKVTLLVNPEDLELMSEQLRQLQSELGGIDQLDIQGERRIMRGGAVARTDVGEIDATISAQLETVRQLVTAALGGALTDDTEAPAAADDKASSELKASAELDGAEADAD